MWLIASLACAATAGAGTSANAHGFGQRYELPLPLEHYLFGAAAVVALSFVIFGLFVRSAPRARAARQIDLLANPLGAILGHPAVILALRVAILVLFVVVILAGLFGHQNPYRNIAPTFAWIIWWVGFALVSAFVGDIWRVVNPWRSVFDGLQWLYRRFGGRGPLGFELRYPAALGVWPASLFLLAITWIELVDVNAGSPAHMAKLLIAYSVITFSGMAAFGRDNWLAHGELFSVVYGTLSRFAPIQARDGRLLLRPFGSGLVGSGPVSVSMTAFVLLLLATVLYDGLIGTGEWALLEDWLRAQVPGLSMVIIKTLGLIVFWLLFLLAYLAICGVMSRLASGEPSTVELARSFALTLVPIAIGYHVAHYLVYLLVQGQYIIPLLSDPFGRGWNLFGTAGYRVDVALAGARFSWYTALGAIVIGHVFAVYLAHIRAITVFGSARVALATQAPLTLLMVVYTFVGLSITAQPLVESRTAEGPAATTTELVVIPADAVLPDAQGSALQAVGRDKTARQKLTYKMLGSAFHDGTKTNAADLLYAYSFAYRWGNPANSERGRYDPYVDAATALLRQHLAGVRFIGVDAASKSFRVGDVNFVREVLTLEVYLTRAPEEPELSAVVAPPWSTLPWPLLVLMEEAVTRGWAAFSQAEAKRRGIEWLDLVRSGELRAKLATLLGELERDAFRPMVLRPYVTEEEARARWSALAAFHKANDHFLVTNGPYKLKSWTPQSVTLEAFRDLTYPLGVGSYDAYAIPRRGFITKADWNGEKLTISGEIEVVETAQRSYRLVRTPLRSIPAAMLTRAAPECRYVVTDMDGRVVAAGTASPGDKAEFQIELKDRLPAGRYTLSAILAVNGNVMNPDIHRVPINVGSGR